jgi:hypothetical protein
MLLLRSSKEQPQQGLDGANRQKAPQNKNKQKGRSNKMKKINEANFKAIYSKMNDKVTIAYGSKKVMGVLNVSKNYDLKNKNGMQIAEIVFNDNKKAARDIVEDFILGF